MHNDYDKLFYPFYAMLTPVEQDLYRQILPGIRLAQTNISVKTTGGSKEVFNVLDAIYQDRPELLWMTGNSVVHTKGGIAVYVQPEYNQYRLSFRQKQLQLRQAILSFTRSLHNKRPYEQERIIHDRLIKEVSYIKHSLDQSAYAALVEKKAVCTGYTKAFQLLMNELDIPCYCCIGKAIGSHDVSWGPHAWNIIMLDNDFYNVDLTWDDCYDGRIDNRISYRYYNCTDFEIQNNHKRSTKCIHLPPCNGTKYSFENVNGVNADLQLIYDDGISLRSPVRCKAEFFNVIEQELRDKKNKSFAISFPAIGESISNNALKWFKEIVKRMYPKTSWKINSNTTNYNNGWYRIELTLILK